MTCGISCNWGRLPLLEIWHAIPPINTYKFLPSSIYSIYYLTITAYKQFNCTILSRSAVMEVKKFNVAALILVFGKFISYSVVHFSLSIVLNLSCVMSKLNYLIYYNNFKLPKSQTTTTSPQQVNNNNGGPWIPLHLCYTFNFTTPVLK